MCIERLQYEWPTLWHRYLLISSNRQYYMTLKHYLFLSYLFIRGLGGPKLLSPLSQVYRECINEYQISRHDNRMHANSLVLLTRHSSCVKERGTGEGERLVTFARFSWNCPRMLGQPIKRPQLRQRHSCSLTTFTQLATCYALFCDYVLSRYHQVYDTTHKKM